MKQKQRLKNLLLLLFLLSPIILEILSKYKVIKFKPLIIDILQFCSGIITIGLLFYACFKITKGKYLIYKNPQQGKNLDNIDVGQSFRRDRYFRYYKHLPPLDKIFLLSWLALGLLIYFVFHPKQVILGWFKVDWLGYIAVIYFLLLITYGKVYEMSSVWIFYVKFFRWYGITFFEKDFHKTINSHPYFPISVFYYEQQKAQDQKIHKAKKITDDDEKNNENNCSQSH